MSIYRSYFSKNGTIIDNNTSNMGLNPVTEISYGTVYKQVSRFIFDVDLSNILDRITKGFINPNRIAKHTLHLTNTISYAPQYIGKKSYLQTINRASSFDLEVFNINQDWDGGSRYDFFYNNTATPQASNWYSGRTNSTWSKAGIYDSGSTEIIGTQRFDEGNEDIDIDVTDYVNQRLFSGYTGTSVYSGNSYGLGIKFTDYYESLETEFRNAVAFHVKDTNTYYVPYIETTIDDTISDDRNYFYLDKDNDLYLYFNVPSFQQNIVVNQVNIYDNEDKLIDTLTGGSISNVGLGIYKITLNIDSSVYPDAVLFRDEWLITVNGRNTSYNGEFYLISEDKYYAFNESNQINPNNYFFYFWGIGERENIRAGSIKKIMLTIKELYPNQDNFIPLEIEYRLFTTVSKKYEIDVIPFTTVNRTNNGYYFNLDTSWLIPQDYYLQIRMKNGNYYENKQTLSFTVVNDGIIKTKAVASPTTTTTTASPTTTTTTLAPTTTSTTTIASGTTSTTTIEPTTTTTLEPTTTTTTLEPTTTSTTTLEPSTTTTSSPIQFLGIQVLSGGIPVSGYTSLTYGENIDIYFNTPVVEDYNYLYISLPNSKSFRIYNADLNVTTQFSTVGTYVTSYGVLNRILRSNDQYNSGFSITYKINIQ